MADVTLRDLLIKIGFDVKDSGVVLADKRVNDLAKSVLKLGTVLIGMGVAFFGLAYSTARNAMELAKYSRILNTSTQELQKLKNAANLSEVSFESLMMGLRMFNRTIGEAQLGHKEFSKKLTESGITSLKVNGQWKSQTELLEEVADKMSKVSNSSKRVAIAMELFGRSGSEMLPFLMQGRKGIEDLLKVTDDYG